MRWAVAGARKRAGVMSLMSTLEIVTVWWMTLRGELSYARR